MIYYIVPLVIFYLGLMLCFSYGGVNATVVFACALPMVALVTLRGHCGTDTAAYYEAFQDLGNGGTYGGEPLFNAYAKMLWTIYPDPRFVVNGISLTTSLLMMWAITRSRYGIWFGGLLLVPAMYYELTMNLLRFGLASAIFLLATRVRPERAPLRYAIYALIGTCTHFSSAVLFLLFAAATRRQRSLLIVGFAIAAIVGALLMPDYIDDKVSLYSGKAAPNALSGVVFLFIQALILAVMIRFRRRFDIPPMGWVICAVLAVALYGLTQVSYAGIRFQLLLVELMIVMLWRQFLPVKGRMNSRIAMCLFVIGLAAMAGRIHNMMDEDGESDSPFLPYQTAPSLQQLG
jgi:hypothetical protein